MQILGKNQDTYREESAGPWWTIKRRVIGGGGETSGKGEGVKTFAQGPFDTPVR